MTVFRVEDSFSFVKKAFLAAGVSDEKAGIMADSLVFASLRGVDSHGISRCEIYLKRVETGLVDKDAEVEVVRSSMSTALIDAHNAMGQYAGCKASDFACSLAKDSGTGLVGVVHSNHFGSAGFYAKRIADHGMIGIVMSNSTKAMALWGAAQPYLGTNPLAYSVPAGKYDPLILDMATSVVARGKIRRALDQGQEIPSDWAVGPDGKRTTNAADAYKGAVLPFGGPKGSAIALFIEILAGVMTGSAVGPQVGSMYSDFRKPQDIGHFFMAIDPGRFISAGLFKQRMEKLVADVKELPPSAAGSEVFLPGEIERRSEQKRRAEGIPIPADVLKSLTGISQKYSIPLPENC